MSAAGQKQLAETLRRYLLTCPDLPVAGGLFSLDGLDPDEESMSLQMNPGQLIKKFLDGGGVVRQPFTIYYRAAATSQNQTKSDMIGALNAVGDWMTEAGPPDLGPGIRAVALEQATMANIADQENAKLGYMATYILDYEVL